MRDCVKDIIPSSEQHCGERQFVRAQLSQSALSPSAPQAYSSALEDRGQLCVCVCVCVLKSSVCYM